MGIAFEKEIAIMTRSLSVGFAALVLLACSGGTVAVGQTDQKLLTKGDGSKTGNGQTCSLDDAVSYDAATGKETVHQTGSVRYNVGEEVPSPDSCNTCKCTVDGVACTTMACNDPPQGCTEEAKTCPDGSAVGRTGPNCEFAPCPQPKGCSFEAKICPDGSSVGRTGPSCEFAPCPGDVTTEPPADGGVVCTADVKECADGSFVSREGPACAFKACPGEVTTGEGEIKRGPKRMGKAKAKPKADGEAPKAE